MFVSMFTRRFQQRRLFAWLSSALLIVAATGAPGGERILHARAEQQTIGSEPNDGTTQFLLRASPADIEAIAARHGLTVISSVGDLFLVSKSAESSSGFSAMSLSPGNELAATVGQDPQVANFETNAIVVTPEVASGVELNHSTAEILDSLNNRTTVTYFGLQAWHGYVNQPAAGAVRLGDTHAASATGASVVAIIDTGVDPNHPLLQGVLVPGYDFTSDTAGNASEWTDLDHSTAEILDHSTAEILDATAAPVPLNPSTVAVLDSDSALDPSQLPAAFGHGTMVAGIVHLVAPTARIMPLKAFAADGTSRTFDIVRAIYYAVDHGARVINMSFSASTTSPEIARAINYATDRGVICVASVGNLGREVVVYPGGFRNVVGVASTNSANPPVRSSFSNYGDSLVSLAAPGEGIITTYPGGGYAAAWGTSFSTPIVAGGAALLLQIDPALDFKKANDQFAKAIAMAPGLGMGWGRLNLFEAARTLPDAVAPTASMLTPASTGFVSGDALVSASASDNVAVAGVKFLLDGSALGVEDTTAPYELSWPTTTSANGAHVLTAIARDAAGNVATSNTSVMVSNDFAPPTIAFTAPSPGIFVNGTVTVSATASDDIGVVGVQFKLDGALAGAEDVDPPYEVSWNTEPVPDGPHTWTVVARDASGKDATSTISVTVTHDVTAPTVAVIAPASEATVSGTITIRAAAADDVSVTSVQLLVDGTPLGTPVTSAPYDAIWSTLSVGNGLHTVTAVARDAVGHVTTANAVSFNVLNDLVSPTVGLVTPAAGATVDGIVTVSATAADDVAVTSVQFLLDGAPLGAAVSAAPYQVEWPTTGATNGAHALTAVARDAAGREATAAVAIVNVRNDLAPPTVLLASPSAGATVSGSITIAATAVDDVGVSSVQFLLDGSALGEVDAEAPYQLDWSTLSVANGAHILTVVARDGAGRETTAEATTILVLNDVSAPTVALASPASGATVHGVVNLTATAADDVSVSSVQFLLDGAPLGEADLEPPYEVSWPTLAVANGPHALAAVARDGAGRETTAEAVTVSVMNDLAPPTVVLASPAAGATVQGAVTVTATAADDIGVSSVQFLLNGASLGAPDSEPPYEVAWPTPAVANGAHALTAVARDAAGRETTSDAVSVTVLNDAAAPTVALTSPAAETTVGGTVTVAATAADDIGVTSVQFLLDGAPVGAPDSEPPYEAAWPTPAVANGAHALTAVARDAAGRETTSDAVSVNVLNDAAAPTVALTSPAAETTVGGTVTVAATAADDIGVTSVQFMVDGAPLGVADTDAPYEAEWVTSTTANGAHTISAVARDAVGHVTLSGSVALTVVNDLAPPTVGLAAPSAGASVDGTVTVSATAADDVGVTSVQFLLDGAPLGAAVTSAPYQVEWATTSATNAAHTVTAVARDAAGRETTATAVIVNVRNDLAAPTVVLASPSAGATVHGAITVTATAVDDVGVTSVQFLLDGAPLDEADAEAPYQLTWSTLSVANGAHTLTATARDGAGRETTAEVTAVTVLNDLAPPTVALASPSAGATVHGAITVTATAVDDVGVTSVQFLLDGAPFGEVATEAPYQVAWSTVTATNGAHAWTAVARDAAGRETTTDAVTVTVLNDAAAPTVAVTSPAAETTIGGTVTVAATAADDIGVTSVQFLVDGALLGAAVTTAPYQVQWPTTSAANGAHALTAVARDAAGRETTATAVVVNVLNDLAAPTVAVTSPAAETMVGGTVTIAATAADDIGVTSVQFLVDGAPLGAAVTTAPYQAEWPTTSATNGAHALTAVARDAAGRETTAAAVVVNVFNDLAAPTVAVTSPAADTTLQGSVAVTATAADDRGVTSVQFLLDGAPLGAAVTTAPYQVEWPTTSATNAPHTLTAVARDAAGRETTAAAVVVNVLNDLAAPSIGLVTPSSGATVDGAIVVSATVTDDVGVTSVQFLLDGAPLGDPVTAAPYQVEWSTTSATNAAHTVTAVARDGAGRETTATAVIVNVRNDLAAPTVLLTSPSAGATVNGAITVTATAVDDVGVTSVQFLLDGAPFGEVDTEFPYQLAWSTLAAPNGTHTWTAVARDAAGRETTAESVSVTVLNDAASPTVAITNPTAETTVGGTLVIAATAADDVGVASVQFFIDGAPLGAADTDAPYEVEWATTASANGSHNVTAVARDAAGRETTSSVSIVVANEPQH
jgi:subtilisin family serine protease